MDRNSNRRGRIRRTGRRTEIVRQRVGREGRVEGIVRAGNRTGINGQ